MDIFHPILVSNFGGVNISRTGTRMLFIHCTMYIGFVTAVSKLEFCKILKSKLSQDNYECLTINELC